MINQWRFHYEKCIPYLQMVLSTPCTNCKSELASTTLQLCGECVLEIPTFLSPVSIESNIISECWTLGPYHSPLGALVRKGKYSNRECTFRLLGEILAGATLDLPEIDAIVSIPLPWSRQWSRGFNQSAILANQIKKILSVPHLHLLKRIDHGELSSSHLNHRYQFLTGRFVIDSKKIPFEIPKTVLLVDDVVTTGTTFEGCAIELLNIGVETIFCVALASTKL